VNLSGQYRFSSSLSFTLNVSNLLDREHYQIFGGSMVGRRAMLTAAMSF
jgi:outer membrane receptor protein involved in Fe transport